jgi:cobalt/nickel transport system permease protein
MPEQSFLAHRHRHGGLIEGWLADLMAVLEHAQRAEHLARTPGLLQRFDPRVRLLATLILICLTILARDLTVIAGLFAVSVCLAWLSRVPIGVLARGIWLSVLLFTGILALPAVFLVPGETVARLPLLGWPLSLQGIESAAFLIGRALTAAGFAALLILCTPWPHLLKALQILGMPRVVIVILGMAYRYLFVLLQAALALFTARRSRQVGRLSGKEGRRILIGTAGVLLGRSLQLADEVYLAMQSRGYRGRHLVITEFRMRPADWAAIAGLTGLLALALCFRL